MLEELLATFVFFFAVIDPFGSVPVFLAATQGFTAQQKKATALHAVLFSAGILLFFIVLGEVLLNAIGIPLPAFQIAGGIVLFLFALTMIFGEGKPEAEIKSIVNTTETAIFPMAIPSIASPGAMLAVVLLTKNDVYSFKEQLISSLLMLLVLVIVYVLLIAASSIHKLIGNAGASVISRIMGLILTSVAVDNVIEGIKTSFGLG
jgi:multiple antibiotic resistance protein